MIMTSCFVSLASLGQF